MFLKNIHLKNVLMYTFKVHLCTISISLTWRIRARLSDLSKAKERMTISERKLAECSFHNAYSYYSKFHYLPAEVSATVLPVLPEDYSVYLQ